VKFASDWGENENDSNAFGKWVARMVRELGAGAAARLRLY